MSCKKCGGELLIVNAKCYDNIELLYSKPVTINQLGLVYDGKTLTIKYCLNCGTVNADFPIKFAEEVVVEDIPAPRLMSEYIQDFYDLVVAKDDEAANRLLRWLSVRISPVDENALSTLASNYVNIRDHSTYPEFDEAVEWMMSRYNYPSL
jgi:hypothetical protein